MTKSEKAKFNALTKQLEEMEKEKKKFEGFYRDEKKAKEELEKELLSVHIALDTLPGIPSRTVKQGYYDRELSVTGRLFSWVAAISFGGRANKTTVKVEEEA